MATWRQRSPWRALLITILKINLRNTTGKRQLPGKGLVRLLLGVLVLLSFIPLEFLFFTFFLSLSRASLAAGQPALVPVLIAVSGQMVVLIFGMFYLMSAFYFSQDIGRMLHLPLRPRQLLGAKFLVVMLGELLTTAVIVVPGFLGYGLARGGGPAYWLMALLVWLMLPLLPLALDTIFTLALARVVNLSRQRDVLRVLGGLLGLVLAIGIQFFSQRFDPGGPAYLPGNLEVFQGLAGRFGSIFPPALWAAGALAMPDKVTGWVNLALLAALSLAVVGLTSLVAERVYFRDLLAGQEVPARRRHQRPAPATLATAGVTAALWRRELKLFLRTPTFVMNGLVSTIIFPLMMVIPALSRGDTASWTLLSQRSHLAGWVALGGAGMVMFLSLINHVAPTAISREGRFIWLLRSLPVEARLLVRVKLLFSLAFAVLGAVLVSGILYLFLHLPPAYLAIMFVLGLLSSWPVAALGLMVDLSYPRLDWVDPQQAMKGNFNGLIAMVLTLPLVLLLALSAFLLSRLGQGYNSIVTLLALELAFTGLATTRILEGMAEKRFRGME
ncbi:MAG: type transport system permease protein [Moorella sp. (in: firmicutes)]|uniref:ABC-2 type transport system permease protein n=1 Tax=Neomoorella thermoacetica TaxID=1525 RepID=A0A1J5NZ26_NEOTH|nr:type transport system permease protein [Moorella sp. (in: firmicutes)]OIQ58603.1 hypothetical protein MOTE_17910 [Moorella thermoacetica]